MTTKQHRLPPSRALLVSIVVAALVIEVVGPIHGAQPPITESWVKQNSSSQFADDQPSGLAVDRQGNVIVTGKSRAVSDYYQYLTVKHAAEDGRVLWSRRFNSRTNSNDYAVQVAVDAQDDVIVTGYAPSNSAHFSHTIKYSGTDGVLQWQRAMTGLVSVLSVNAQGNALLGGRCFSAKLAASNGAVLWENRRPYFALDFNNAILTDQNGDFVVGRHTGFNAQTAKLNGQTGATLWVNTNQSQDPPSFYPDASSRMVLDGGNNAIVCRYDWQLFRDFVSKLDASSGSTLWHTALTNSFFSDSLNALATDTNGDVFVVGSYGYVAKLSGTNGQVLWQNEGQLFPGLDDLVDVATDKWGNLSVVGLYYVSEDFYLLYVAKYSGTDGALLWERLHPDRIVAGAKVAVQPGGNTVVSTATMQATEDESFRWDFLTILYAPFLPRLSIKPILSGMRLEFPGVAGRNYEIQHAPSLNGSWNTLLTANAPADGLIVHTNTTVGPGGFFRVSAAP